MMQQKKSQNGATLLVGMIMLLLIMVMVVTAVRMSSSNTQAVANMQFREQAIAAANMALEQALTADFSHKFASAQTLSIDINNDSVNDFSVTVDIPVCTEATQPTGADEDEFQSSQNLGFSAGAASPWDVLLDFNLLAVDTTTGARAAIRAGVRKQMSETVKTSWCG